MSDGLSASVFLLVVQLPAKVSDGLSYSVFLLLSFRLISISFFPQWPADFYDTFLQRRDICDIFASRQGSFRSFTFSFFRRNDISGGPCPGGGIPGGPHRAGLILSKKNLSFLALN